MAQHSDLDGWQALEEAKRLAAAGQRAEALALLNVAARSAGTRADLFLAMGDLYGELKDEPQARAFWRAAATRASASSTRSGAHRRLANDALRRGRTVEAMQYFEQYVQDRPDDRTVLLRLVTMRMSGLPGSERDALLSSYRERYTVLRDPLIEAALVLPFTDPERALAVLQDRLDALVRAGVLAVRAVDSFIEANRSKEALILADRLAQQPAAGERELNCVLRAEKAAGREPELALARFDHHLGRHAEDHKARLKKAKLLLHLRRWHAAHGEAGQVLAAEPDNVPAAELMIQALVRLDRPNDARAVRERVAQERQRRGREQSAELSRLDLALADGEAALSREGEDGEEEGDSGGLSQNRVDVLMAVGDYAGALELITAGVRRLDDAGLKVKGIRCASALTVPHTPGTRFPEAAFRAGIALERELPGPLGGAVLVTSTLGAGGAERQVALTAAGISGPLRELGMPTHLVCRDLRAEYNNRVMLPIVQGSGAEVVDLAQLDGALAARRLRAAGLLSDDDLRLISSFPLPAYRSIALLLEQFLTLRPRVVHLWQDGIICVGSVAAMMAGVPRIVCSIRNVVPTADDTRRARPYLAGVYQALATRPRVLLTANAAMGARDYEAKFGLPPDSIGVIRNGLEVSQLIQRRGPDGRQRVRQELGIPEGYPVLGAVFRLVPAKRPHRWLEVAARLSESVPNLHMLVVGEGPLRLELQELAASLGIGGRTVFSGAKSPVEPWIAAMDTMLLSSDVEGLPNVLIEAQALGVPVVTTDAGGAREAVDDGITGTVVTDTSTEALVEACAAFLTSPDRRARAEREGPGFVASRFGVERMVRETLAVLGLSEPGRR